MPQRVNIKFIGGPDDGLVADTESDDAILAQAAFAYAGMLDGKGIGQPYYGVALNLAVKLASGQVSPQQLIDSGLAKWHAYRIAEKNESAEQLELVLQHDATFDPRKQDV